MRKRPQNCVEATLFYGYVNIWQAEQSILLQILADILPQKQRGDSGYPQGRGQMLRLFRVRAWSIGLCK